MPLIVSQFIIEIKLFNDALGNNQRHSLCYNQQNELFLSSYCVTVKLIKWQVVGGVPGQPGSRWHTTYENACAGPSLLLNCECATAARSMCLYDKSFCNFVTLSFIWGKIQGDEVEVEKLLIVIFINRQLNNMSLEKRRFSEFSLFNKSDPFNTIGVNGSRYLLKIPFRSVLS